MDAAERLGLPEVYVVGHLVALWAWALDNAPDGTIPRASARLIARAAQWTGDPQTFLDTLIAVGYLDRDDAAIAVHDWDDYAGKLIDQRHANAERQRRHRERHKSETSAPPAEVITPTSPLRNGATVPNPTVPNPTQPDRGAKAPSARAREAASRAAGVESPPVPAEFSGTTKLTPGPAPAKLAEVIDAITAEGVEVPVNGKIDGQAVKQCSGHAADIAAAFVAAARGEWGGEWLQQNLSVQAVCKRLPGYLAWRDQPRAPPPNGRIDATAAFLRMAKGEDP